jgi:hypothetical protein
MEVATFEGFDGRIGTGEDIGAGRLMPGDDGKQQENSRHANKHVTFGFMGSLPEGAQAGKLAARHRRNNNC